MSKLLNFTDWFKKYFVSEACIYCKSEGFVGDKCTIILLFNNSSGHQNAYKNACKDNDHEISGATSQKSGLLHQKTL